MAESEALQPDSSFEVMKLSNTEIGSQLAEIYAWYQAFKEPLNERQDFKDLAIEAMRRTNEIKSTWPECVQEAESINFDDVDFLKRLNATVVKLTNKKCKLY